MEPGSVSLFCPATERVATHNGMMNVSIVIIQDNNFGGVRRIGQHNNRVFRGNINGIWKLIRGIEGYLFRARTFINGNGG